MRGLGSHQRSASHLSIPQSEGVCCMVLGAEPADELHQSINQANIEEIAESRREISQNHYHLLSALLASDTHTSISADKLRPFAFRQKAAFPTD